MGADGGIYIITKDKWDKQNFGIVPQDIGLIDTQGIIFGYRGTNVSEERTYGTTEHMGEGWIANYHHYAKSHILTPIQESKLKAVQWFENNSQYHELWT